MLSLFYCLSWGWFKAMPCFDFDNTWQIHFLLQGKSCLFAYSRRCGAQLPRQGGRSDCGCHGCSEVPAAFGRRLLPRWYEDGEPSFVRVLLGMAGRSDEARCSCQQQQWQQQETQEENNRVHTRGESRFNDNRHGRGRCQPNVHVQAPLAHAEPRRLGRRAPHDTLSRAGGGGDTHGPKKSKHQSQRHVFYNVFGVACLGWFVFDGSCFGLGGNRANTNTLLGEEHQHTSTHILTLIKLVLPQEDDAISAEKARKAAQREAASQHGGKRGFALL